MLKASSICKATGLWKVNTEACHVTYLHYLWHYVPLEFPLVCTALKISLPLY
jgi:hypothetical protein